MKETPETILNKALSSRMDKVEQEKQKLKFEKIELLKKLEILTHAVENIQIETNSVADHDMSPAKSAASEDREKISMLMQELGREYQESSKLIMEIESKLTSTRIRMQSLQSTVGYQDPENN